MILIADSGSTTTYWTLLEENKVKLEINTQGLNPYFTSPELMKEIISKDLVPTLTCDTVTSIFIYGAGCSTAKNNSLVRLQVQGFLRNAEINVYHDILGAARALFGDHEGIACILGTGCNSCFYDGKEVYSRIPSLGYLFGDEGAGSNIGKKLIGRYLKGELPEEIRMAFDERYHYSLEDILNSLYNKPFPNRFLASFSLFLLEHTGHPYIHDLIYSSFLEFFEAHV